MKKGGNTMRKRWILVGLAGFFVFITLFTAGVLPVCANYASSDAFRDTEVSFKGQTQKEDDYSEMVEEVLKNYVADGKEGLD